MTDVPLAPANLKDTGAPMQMTVALNGDQRLVENVILEVRAIAQRLGLEIPNVSVTRQPAVGPKTKKPALRRKTAAKASQASSS